jgi:ATP-binding cassette, subfamily B, bacterial
MPDEKKPLGPRERALRFAAVFRYTPRALGLVWETSRPLTLALLGLTLLGGLLPASIAWVGKHIIDGVVAAAAGGSSNDALRWVAVEAGLVFAMGAVQRGLELSQSLLRAQLGQRVNELILEKALTLDLPHFEDSQLYDRLTRARREASSRPLALVRRVLGLTQNSIALVTYGALLLSFSGWAVLLLAVAAIPAFIGETRFAGEAFRLFRWRSPETRMQLYLEAVVSRSDSAKEVKLMDLGPTLVGRYKAIFQGMYGEDRNLALRRGGWGFLLEQLAVLARYGVYAWVVLRAAAAAITLGQMTLYLMVFKQGQSAFSAMLEAIGGMYEDNLYLSNLYELLDQPVEDRGGTATSGPDPSDGLRLEGVGFSYPGATTPALHGVSLHLQPGGKLALVGPNGSGKTTLIKLLTRLYQPTEGRILLDGLDLAEWDVTALRRRFGVIFQDYVQYQLKVGENVGVGDVRRLDDTEGWQRASVRGMAAPFIEALPDGYQTQLGGWFKNGRELSQGQWQKIALSRAFMREDADVLVLDEPTAAMDAEAEAEVFERVRSLRPQQMAILISHRFSTVRMADHIVVIEAGQIVEQGDHGALMAGGGTYARLFGLQAEGYR